MTMPALTSAERDRLWLGPIIDVDVHAVVPSIDVLLPYLDGVWVERFKEVGTFTAASLRHRADSALAAHVRREWLPSDGRPAASDVDLVREHLLDPMRTSYAIVNCVYPLDGGHPDLAAALARAINDWLVAEWLDVDDRLRASVVVPSRSDPAAMAAEIDRVGSHPGFVQALLPVRSGKGYGQRVFWPVFEALVRNGLVAGIHRGGTNDGLPPTCSGWPSYYIEEYVGEVQLFETQLISLVAEGVFNKFSDLRVSMLEIGFTWVPMWMWDMDRNWRGLRREIPWLTRPPFEEVREHVRFSVAPIDADSVDELSRVIRWLGSDELLMFATDYPHYHDDNLSVLLDALPEESRAKLMAENARKWYRLGGTGAVGAA